MSNQMRDSHLTSFRHLLQMRTGFFIFKIKHN